MSSFLKGDRFLKIDSKNSLRQNNSRLITRAILQLYVIFDDTNSKILEIFDGSCSCGITALQRVIPHSASNSSEQDHQSLFRVSAVLLLTR